MTEREKYFKAILSCLILSWAMPYAGFGQSRAAPCDTPSSTDGRKYTRADNGTIEINGEILETEVIDGDTVLLATLSDVTVTSPRSFDNYEEYLKYKKYKRYAAKVYPYAVDAIKIFKQTEYLTRHMDKRYRRRHIKALQDRLEEDFKEPLKGLTKTQGKILVNMIERELDMPIYYLIKDLRGGLAATFWSTTGFFFGYHLKQGYTEGEDPLMDAVLEDLDIDVGDPPYDMRK